MRELLWFFGILFGLSGLIEGHPQFLFIVLGAWLLNYLLIVKPRSEKEELEKGAIEAMRTAEAKAEAKKKIQQETKMLEWKLRMKETYSNFAPEGAFCIGMLREDMLESATFEGWSTDKKFGVIENQDCEIYTFFTDDYKPLDRAFHYVEHYQVYVLNGKIHSYNPGTRRNKRYV